jgi:hypothetical protein
MESSKDEKKDEGKNLEGLYDLAIPLSMPVSVIRELVEKFDLDLIRRNVKMDMTGEVMDREVLVLRGDMETVMAAKKYMFEALDKKMIEWERSDKAEKYRKAYEERVAEAAKERAKSNKKGQSGGWDTTNML